MYETYSVFRKGTDGTDTGVGRVDAASAEEAVFRLVGGEYGRTDYGAARTADIAALVASRKLVKICVWYAADPERGTGWFYDTAEDSGGFDRISPQGPFQTKEAAKGSARLVYLTLCEFLEDVTPEHYDGGPPAD